jgi:pimeloyl-ACP methyl ester carboxylesterase
VRARYAQFLRHWPATNEQFRISTSQGVTFVIACGPVAAPPVLLLHGALANSSTWMGAVAAWSQHFRLYAVDMIGEPGFSAPSRPLLRSEAYALWLDEVLAGLGVEKAALAGISLGDWLALDYATRRPERVRALALLCPGGVGKQKNILLWAAPLLLLGPWGQRMVLRKLGAGALSEATSPAAKAFGDFMRLIQTSAHPRCDILPRFSDAALARLNQPLMAILGAKDAILDSAGTRGRLTKNVAQADIRWLPDEGHFLFGKRPIIEAFLRQVLTP